MAKKIVEGTEGVREATVLLLSRIGTPISEPQVANAQVLLQPGRSISGIREAARGVIAKELASITSFCRDLSRGKYPIC
jgi:S-adenosylmethionine synthetase